MIHIACCSNEKLAPIFGVVLTSVGINVTSDDVTIHLVHNSLKPRTVKRLQKIADKYNVELDFKQIDTDILKDCYFDKSKHYGDIMMFARLLLSSVLPDLDKIIYLDCDIVVLKDLQSLWNLDISDVAVAMAPDLTFEDKKSLNRLGMTSGYYLNSGVILMNLDYWRKHDVQNRVISYILEKGDKLIYNDQDALNSILQNEHKVLHIKYNYSYCYFHRLIGVSHKEKIREIIEARDNPVIFHYFLFIDNLDNRMCVGKVAIILRFYFVLFDLLYRNVGMLNGADEHMRSLRRISHSLILYNFTHVRIFLLMLSLFTLQPISNIVINSSFFRRNIERGFNLFLYPALWTDKLHFY